jgi:hypothetical protein
MEPSDEHVQRLAEYIADNKASVVVGAGFSLNAIPKDSRCKRTFPLWGEIASQMYSRVCQKLGDGFEDDQIGYDRWKGELTYLEIASLFESLFDRTELNKLIRLIIPDNEYDPGEAHTHLLSLPWKDVFTTNFDTLLERANNDGLRYQYHLVEKDDDLLLSGKPKIVKLHGSFSADKPFIVTQKDYETYVEQNQVFANKMKLALTENAFCLIGFSGRDPNFDDRTWWARFHLRGKGQPTYLVCLEKVSRIKREFYKSRAITTIELNKEVVEAKRRGESEENAKRTVIVNFLKKLYDLVSANLFSKSEGGYDYRDLIPIYLSHAYHPKGKRSPDNLPLEAIDLQKQYEIWREEREDYPGWIIAPMRYRSNLWYFTEQWIEPILLNIEKVPPTFALFLLYELNWRFDLTFCPLTTKWIRVFDQIIHHFDIEIPQRNIPSSSVPKGSSTSAEETKKISDCLFSLHLSIARAARENQDIQRYSDEIEYLHRNLCESEIRKQQLGYEKAIGSLSVFDEDRLRDCLQPENWPFDVNDHPDYALRRAAILAELGDTDDAKEIVRDAIAILQAQNKKVPPDQNISGYSQEAWGQLLLKALNLNWPPIEQDEDEINRKAQLELFGLDPSAELSQLVYQLKPDPRGVPEKENKTIEFDPGHFSVTGGIISFSSELEISDLIPSYAMLKLFEIVGLPYRCGMVSLFKEGVIDATNYISQNSEYLSILSLLRTGDQDAILSRFSRMDVATMSEELIGRLFSILETSIPQAISNLRENESRISLYSTLFAQRIIGTFPEILSRLALRLSPEQLSRAYSLSLSLYQEPVLLRYYNLNESVKNILPRALFAMESSSVVERLPDLLSLPIPGDDSPIPAIPEKWIDPFLDGEWLKDISIEAGFERESLDRSIDHLIIVSASEEPETRRRAILRLLRLYEKYLLTKSQAEEYGRVLWSQTDERHLPLNTGLNIHALLDLPEPNPGRIKGYIKESLLAAKYQRYIAYGVGENGKKNRTFHGFSSDSLPWDIVNVSNTKVTHLSPYPKNRIDWTDNEIEILFSKIDAHWTLLRVDLDREKANPMPFFRGQIDDQLNGIVRVLGDLIIPAFLKMDRVDLAHRCEVILREIGNYDIQISPALFSLIQLDSRLAKEAEIYIYKGLVSENENEVRKAHEGIYNWLIISQNAEDAVSLPPQHLWDLITFELLLLRQPGLDNTIYLFCRRLDRRLGEFPDRQRTMMVASLEKLDSELDSIEKGIRLNSRRFIGISRIEVPYYRWLCAQFGCALTRYYIKEHLEIPPGLEEIKRKGVKDTLPEVRKVWRKKRTHFHPMAAE